LPSEGCPTKLLILSGKKIVAEQPAITTEEGASAFRFRILHVGIR